MEKLLNFEDIALIPAILNNGTTGQDKNDYGVVDTDGVVSLPIFTSPVDSIEFGKRPESNQYYLEHYHLTRDWMPVSISLRHSLKKKLKKDF